MAPMGVNDYFSIFLFILFVKRHIFCHLQPPCCTTTSTSGPPSIWVTLDSMRILHGCGKFLLRPDTDPGATGLLSTDRATKMRSEQQRPSVLRASTETWNKKCCTVYVMKDITCQRRLGLCQTYSGVFSPTRLVFIYIYELSLHSLSQHATFPPCQCCTLLLHLSCFRSILAAFEFISSLFIGGFDWKGGLILWQCSKQVWMFKNSLKCP